MQGQEKNATSYCKREGNKKHEVKKEAIPGKTEKNPWQDTPDEKTSPRKKESEGTNQEEQRKEKTSRQGQR